MNKRKGFSLKPYQIFISRNNCAIILKPDIINIPVIRVIFGIFNTYWNRRIDKHIKKPFNQHALSVNVQFVFLQLTFSQMLNKFFI